MKHNYCDVVGGMRDVIDGVRDVAWGTISGDGSIECGGGKGEGEDLVDGEVSGGVRLGGEGRSDCDAVSGEVGDVCDSVVRWKWSRGLESGGASWASVELKLVGV